MPRDVNGNYTLPLPPVITGTTIDIAWANPTMEDLRNAMTDSLSRTGSGGMLDVFKAVDGAVGAPGIAFVTEPTLGFYRPAAGVMGVAIGGNEVANFDATNKIAVTRDHGAGLQKYAVADSFTELAAGGTAFDLKFNGFESTGLHKDYTGDLNDIIANSLYQILASGVTNEPADMTAGRAFLHTMMHTDSNQFATQVLYGMNAGNEYKIWQRQKDTDVWGAWKLVVDNGAFPQRLDGLLDTGLHAEYTGDLDDIARNSIFMVLGSSVTNEPADFDTFARALIHTLFNTGGNLTGTQLLYGMNGGNNYRIWMRHKSTTWGAWLLVVDGNKFYIDSSGQPTARTGVFIVRGAGSPLVDIRSTGTVVGGGAVRYMDLNNAVRVASTNNLALDELTWALRSVANSPLGSAALEGSGNIRVSASAPTNDNHLARKDYVDGLVGSGAIFDAKFAGFVTTGLHANYASDLNLIEKNSIWNIIGATVTNEPSDFDVNGYGCIHTQMHSGTTNIATQVLYGQTLANTYKIWMRHKNTTWSAWKLVVSDVTGKFYGEIKTFLQSNTPPIGLGLRWADGQLLLRADYPECFAALVGDMVTDATWLAASNSDANGVALFSTGDGSTNFRVPDLEGEFLRGYTAKTTRDPDQPGRGSAAWQADMFKDHTHTYNNAVSTVNYSINDTPFPGSNQAQVTGSTGGDETRPRNLPMRYWVYVGGIA